MSSREALRLNKAMGGPPPWTDDPILRDYKFTNVKREHDYTTIGFQAIIQQHRDDDPATIIFNSGVHRYFGTLEFASALGWQDKFEPDRIKTLAQERKALGLPVFTNAYTVNNGGIKKPKIEAVVDHFLGSLFRRRHHIVRAIRETNGWQRAVGEMANTEGFGGTGFMAKETLLDTLRTCVWEGGEPRDFNTWCPAGPGAREGIARVLGNDGPTLPEIKEDRAVQVMRDLYAARNEYWPSDAVPLVLHDIQFCLCEFNKYERVRLGQGTARRYRPRQRP